jgi:hypothetical protein
MPTRPFTLLDPQMVAVVARAYDEALRDLGLAPKPSPNDPSSLHHQVAQHLIALVSQGEHRLRQLRDNTVAAVRQSTSSPG